MKITLLVIGKTDTAYLIEGINEYVKRINHYINFDIEVIPDIRKGRNLAEDQQKNLEGELIIAKNVPGKELHLFDEKGKCLLRENSQDFLKKMASGLKELVMVIGGPYGFSQKVYENANSKISLSQLTFSHQMVRLMCVEQIYRAFTILKTNHIIMIEICF